MVSLLSFKKNFCGVFSYYIQLQKHLPALWIKPGNVADSADIRVSGKMFSYDPPDEISLHCKGMIFIKLSLKDTQNFPFLYFPCICMGIILSVKYLGKCLTQES